MPVAVLLDFYGTVATASSWTETPDAVLARHGYPLPREVRQALSREAVEGIDHHEHSESLESYVDWDRRRFAALVAACGVPDRLAAEVLEETWTARRPAELRAYPEARSVLLALRARNVAVGLCSNWGWDLADDVEQVGLAGCFDAVVSSAQAGARKPHARIFRYALDRLGARADEVLFVGDTVVADVHGPLRVGMRAAYLRRPAAAAWPGLGGGDQDIDPDPPALPSGVPWIEDLADLPRLLGVDGLALPGPR